MKLKIGFIGAGNMGGALAFAAAKSENKIFICDKDEAKALAVAEKCGGIVLNEEEIIKTCDYVFLGVKPQVLPDLLNSIKDVVKTADTLPCFISMAAGVSLKTLSEGLGNGIKILRIMPNLPVSVGKGVILICKNAASGEEDISAFCEYMSKGGKIIPIEEKYIDAASAISGCGPAFVYMFIKAITEGGVNCGLSYDTAIKLAAQTLIGAANMVLSSDKSPDELTKDVCSPGGTTIEGVRLLESNGFNTIASNAVAASYKRTKELAN